MSRLLARLQRDEMARQHAALVAHALLESGANMPPRGRSAAGDPRRLRGIPVIARGVSGTVPGTSPESILQRDP